MCTVCDQLHRRIYELSSQFTPVLVSNCLSDDDRQRIAAERADRQYRAAVAAYREHVRQCKNGGNDE